MTKFEIGLSNKEVATLAESWKATIENPAYTGLDAKDSDGNLIPEFIPNPVTEEEYVVNKIGEIVGNFLYRDSIRKQKEVNTSTLKVITKKKVKAKKL